MRGWVTTILRSLLGLFIALMVLSRIVAMVYSYGTEYYWQTEFWKMIKGSTQLTMAHIISGFILLELVLSVTSITIGYFKFLLLLSLLLDLTAFSLFTVYISHSLPSQRTALYSEVVDNFDNYNPNVVKEFYGCTGVVNCSDTCCNAIIDAFIQLILGEIYADTRWVWLAWLVSSIFVYLSFTILSKCFA